MTIRPILFSGPMVRALLEGRKTQTRRVISFPGIDRVIDFVHVATDEIGRPVYEMKGATGRHLSRPSGKHFVDYQFSPNFAVNDLLYVREAHYLTDDAAVKEHLERVDNLPAYFAPDLRAKHRRLRPPMHMPRWASRITLKVTNVRVQRLQEISHSDAIAEGVEMESADPPFYYVPGIWPHSLTAVGVEEPGPHAEKSFSKLWDSLNDERGFGWQANPWVVAVTFDVHQVNVDHFEQEVAA